MTLVSAMQIRVPILLGDALLSSSIIDAARLQHEPIPTIDDLSRLTFSEANRRVSGLRNKLAVINSKLAVGWTGKCDRASDVIEYIKRTLSSSPDLDNLQNRLREARDLLREHGFENADVTLVGCLVVDGLGCAKFRWRGEDGSFETGSFFAEGTGAETLRKQFDRRAALKADVEHPLLFAVETVGLLLAHEIFEGANVPHFFGSGFDIVYYHAGAFRRPLSVTHLFSHVDLESLEPDSDWFSHFRPTSLWQVFDGEWTIERVDFSITETPIRPDTNLSFRILGVPNHFRIPLITPEDSAPDLPTGDIPATFISITTGFFYGNYELHELSHVFWTPHPAIHVAKNETNIEVRFSDYVLEEMNRSWQNALRAPVNQDQIEAARAARLATAGTTTAQL